MKLLTAAVLLGVANAFMPSVPKFHRTDKIARNVALIPGNNFVFDEMGSLENNFVVENKAKAQAEDAVLEPDFQIANGLASIGAGITAYQTLLDGHPSFSGVAGGLFHVFLAASVAFQTARVRCAFDKDGLELYNADFKWVKLVPKPGNWQTGLKNRWSYDKIKHFGFFPSSDLPILLYFKETQTPKKFWKKNIAFFDIGGGGQPHLLPAIFNAQKFKEQLESRGVKRITRH